MQEEMIRQLRILKQRTEELAEAEVRGEDYVRQVRDDVEEDLRPLRESVQNARASVETMLREENGGEKFKVPGLGTAYLSRRRRTTITDQEAFIEAFDEKTGGGSGSFYEPKLVPSRVKQAAEGYLREHGELLPGVESEEVESLNLRFK